jgi:mRNA interferase MazF
VVGKCAGMTSDQVHRGYIYLVDYEATPGSAPGKKRPVLVVQNDMGNATAGTTIVVALSSKVPARLYPFHVVLPADVLGRPGVIMCEQIRTVGLDRVELPALAQCPGETMALVEDAIRHSLGFSPETASVLPPR